MSDNLSPTMERALEQFQQTGSFDGFRKSTIEALQRRELISKNTADTAIRESAALPRRNAVRWRGDDSLSYLPFDVGQGDYNFWTKAVAGKVKGLQMAGLFLKPLGSKTAAWVMGDPPKFQFENDNNQEHFNTWWNKAHSDVIRGLEESVNKGDSFLVINPPNETGKLEVTIVPAQVVTPIVDNDDYSRVIGWRIVETHPHPDNSANKMTIIDEYTAEKRVRTIKKNGGKVEKSEYPNLIGRVPVIHIPNNKGSDERFGHAEGEALLDVLYNYDTVFQYAIAGNKRQGRPTPVISQMGTQKEIDAFWKTFGKREVRTLPDGTQEEVYVLELDSDRVMTLGGNAKFTYEQPGSFSGDTVALLGLMFYLILQHTEFPEFIWGNAIASSKASADSQMPPFVKFIEKKRGQCSGWMIEMAMIVLGYINLYEKGIDVTEDPEIKWISITNADGKLTLDAVRLAMDKNLVDDETALSLMPLDIDNPAEAIKKRREELKAQQDEFEREADAAIARKQNQNNDADAQTADTELSTSEQDPATQELIRRARIIVRQQYHGNGAMVAFKIPDDVGQTLYDATLDAGMTDPTLPEDMHITLAYLGDTTDIDIDREALNRAMQRFVDTHVAIDGIINGVGRFNHVNDDGETAVYASFSSKPLPDFREDLVDILESEGITVVQNHGFTPHITLGYLKEEEDTPQIKIPEIELTFTSINTQLAQDVTEYELEQDMEVEAA